LHQILLHVSGSVEQIGKAFDMIFKVIVNDPQSGSCPYISYSDFKGPVANANPTGSPFAVGMLSGMDAGGGSASYGYAGSTAMMYSGAYMGSGVAPYAVEAVKSTLRNSGFSVQASDEISAAMCTLANYGLLGSGFGFAGFGFGAGPGQCGLTIDFLTGILSGQRAANSLMPSGGGMQKGDKSFGSQFANGSDMFPGAGAMMNQNSFGLGTGMSQYGGRNETVGDGSSGSQTKELQIGENIVGAVLGHGGRAIVEIQRMTSTTIQISKKGVFAPGTRNRTATISGPPAGVERAVMLVQQCIQQEENKRSRQEKMLK